MARYHDNSAETGMNMSVRGPGSEVMSINGPGGGAGAGQTLRQRNTSNSIKSSSKTMPKLAQIPEGNVAEETGEGGAAVTVEGGGISANDVQVVLKEGKH